MVIVLGKMVVEQGQLSAVVELLKEVTDETRKEAGCIQYAFAHDVAEPTVIWLSEKWESQAALDAHGATAHLGRFREKMGQIPIRSFHVTRYDASGESVLMSR
jgi:quinol monooxygenase YgiN